MNMADKINFLYMIVLGGVLHLVLDWMVQNDWQAANKVKRRVQPKGWIPERHRSVDKLILYRGSKWYDRHPAAYVHAIPHGLVQLLIFPWWGALIIGITHLVIDTRTPLTAWAKLIGQALPEGRFVLTSNPKVGAAKVELGDHRRPLWDVGSEVAFWRDQTAHIVVITVVAFLAVVTS